MAFLKGYYLKGLLLKVIILPRLLATAVTEAVSALPRNNACCLTFICQWWMVWLTSFTLCLILGVVLVALDFYLVVFSLKSGFN